MRWKLEYEWIEAVGVGLSLFVDELSVVSLWWRYPSGWSVSQLQKEHMSACEDWLAQAPPPCTDLSCPIPGHPARPQMTDVKTVVLAILQGQAWIDIQTDSQGQLVIYTNLGQLHDGSVVEFDADAPLGVYRINE